MTFQYQVELLSWPQKLRVLRQREVSRMNVSPDDDERVAYRSKNGSTGAPTTEFHLPLCPFVPITYCCPFRAVLRVLTLLFYTLFLFLSPLPDLSSDNQGACSAARHSPGELRSTKRLDLSSDGLFLRLQDTMPPSDQH